VAVAESPSRPVNRYAFSRDGGLFAACHGKQVSLWDWPEARLLRTYQEATSANYGGAAPCVACSTDGRFLDKGLGKLGRSCPEGTLCIWDVTTGQEGRQGLGHNNEVTAVAFSPIGKTAASNYERFRSRTVDQLLNSYAATTSPARQRRVSGTGPWRFELIVYVSLRCGWPRALCSGRYAATRTTQSV